MINLLLQELYYSYFKQHHLWARISLIGDSPEKCIFSCPIANPYHTFKFQSETKQKPLFIPTTKKKPTKKKSTPTKENNENKKNSYCKILQVVVHKTFSASGSPDALKTRILKVYRQNLLLKKRTFQIISALNLWTKSAWQLT